MEKREKDTFFQFLSQLRGVLISYFCDQSKLRNTYSSLHNLGSQVSQLSLLRSELPPVHQCPFEGRMLKIIYNVLNVTSSVNYTGLK